MINLKIIYPVTYTIYNIKIIFFLSINNFVINNIYKLKHFNFFSKFNNLYKFDL